MDRQNYPVFRNNPHLLHFDVAAAFPVHDHVLSTLHMALSENVASPGKAHYDNALTANKSIEDVRGVIARNINAKNTEIFFSFSASDSARQLHDLLAKNYQTVIYSPEDHSSVTRLFLNTKTVQPIYYGMNGTYILDDITASNSNSIIVFVSLVHQLYGSDNDIAAIRKKFPHAFIVVDASQAIGKIAIDVNVLQCDALFFSSQKIGGIAGAGVVYVSSSHRHVTTQYTEPNSLPLPAIVSMKAALEVIASQRIATIDLQLIRQSSLFVQLMNSRVGGVTFSKGMAHSEYRCRSVGIISFKIDGYTSHDVAMILNDHAINVRAADHCVDDAVVDRDVVRISMHAFTRDEDIVRLVDVLAGL